MRWVAAAGLVLILLAPGAAAAKIVSYGLPVPSEPIVPNPGRFPEIDAPSAPDVPPAPDHPSAPDVPTLPLPDDSDPETESGDASHQDPAADDGASPTPLSTAEGVWPLPPSATDVVDAAESARPASEQLACLARHTVSSLRAFIDSPAKVGGRALPNANSCVVPEKAEGTPASQDTVAVSSGRVADPGQASVAGASVAGPLLLAFIAAFVAGRVHAAKASRAAAAPPFTTA